MGPEALEALRFTLRVCSKEQERAFRKYKKTGSARAFQHHLKCLDQAIAAAALLQTHEAKEKK